MSGLGRLVSFPGMFVSGCGVLLTFRVISLLMMLSGSAMSLRRIVVVLGSFSMVFVGHDFSLGDKCNFENRYKVLVNKITHVVRTFPTNNARCTTI